MRRFCCLLSILLAVLHQVTAIVGAGRDLVLTPKQALQLSGKRLYYEEQPPGAADRTWEHTLKHVTYVTLFTDAAEGAASGNLSQLHDYHDFLQTPYIPSDAQAQSAQSRFGDIVTVASGRLEQLSSNGSYRFVEGTADPNQTEQGMQTRALWRVQRIRHRDGDTQRSPHRYHYEMKFSVSPLASSIGWPPQSFIQKEADYPQSFGRVAYEEKRDQTFAQRRQDRDRQPQATFIRGVFQPPPPPPHPHPLPNLNIGEYLKAVSESPKGSPKVEVFPGLYNLGLRPNYIPATTFRPSYPIKFGMHPEMTTPLERYPLPNELNSGTSGDAVGVAGAPVTHHFHHHFYMTPGGLNEGNSQPEHGYRAAAYVPELTTLSPPTSPPPHQQQHKHRLQFHYELEHKNHQPVQFPTNHASGSVESLETGEDLHHNQDQHPLVRSPQLYTVYDQASKYQTSKLAPLLIYAGGGAEAGEEQKSFVQSEPLEETVYRYSEPDPLYVHQNPVDVLQLESPHSYDSDEPQHHQHHAEVHKETSEEIAQVEEEQEDQHRESAKEPEQRPAGSQKQSKVASTPTPSIRTAPSVMAATPEGNVSSTVAANPTVASSSKASFVSTSTSTTPLRALSRYRTTPRITAGRSTTTTTTSTETPSFSKWKQRRKENSTGLDSKAKSSHRHESKLALPSPTATSTTTTTITMMSPLPTNGNKHSNTTELPATTAAVPIAGPLPVPGREVIEVLTQKSVSKSVSIKVGENGEEIPIIVDDDENEVKRT